MSDERDQIAILIDGLKAALRDPECPVQFGPLSMECAQVLSALHPVARTLARPIGFQSETDQGG